MQNISLSPLRSPNKQKPKINLKNNHTLLRERPSFLDNGLNQLDQSQNSNLKYITKGMTNDYAQLNKQNFLFKSNEEINIKVHQSRSNKLIQNGTPKFSISAVALSCQKFKCQKCSKRKQSYIIVQDNMKFCSNCALQQMKKGKQVRNLKDFQDLRGVSPDCSKIKLKCTDIRKSRQIETFEMLKKIEESQNKLNQLINNKLKQNISCDIFSLKRQQLKLHYEKLKEIIQESIKKDLQNIKKEEEIHLQQKRTKKQFFKKDLTCLSQIRNEIKRHQYEYERSQNISSDQFEYITKASRKALQILNKITKEEQLLENFYKQSSLVKKTCLYNPSIYMMTIKGNSVISFCNQYQQPPNPFFSFQKN